MRVTKPPNELGGSLKMFADAPSVKHARDGWLSASLSNKRRPAPSEPIRIEIAKAKLDQRAGLQRGVAGPGAAQMAAPADRRGASKRRAFPKG